MHKGKYIVFEGIDGCGKTTQVNMLMKRLRRKRRAHHTAEPTDGPVGKLLKQILSGEIKIDKRVMGMLFIPDTLDHFLGDFGIVTTVKTGAIVVSDRSYFSTFAYQSEYLPIDWLIHAHSISFEMLKPDVVIYLYTDPTTCYQRLIDRGKKLQVHETLEKLKLTQDKYLEAFSLLRNETTIVTVDGNNSKEEVHKVIWEYLIEKIL